MVLVTYDVSTETSEGRSRLRKTAKVCLNYGQRVQNSVFECLVDPAQWTELKNRLVDIINKKRRTVYVFISWGKTGKRE